MIYKVILLFHALHLTRTSIVALKKDFYRHGEVVDSIKAPSVFTCLHKCKINGKCDFTNFNKLQQRCEFIRSNSTSNYQLERKDNWISSEIVSKQIIKFDEK